MLIIADVFGVWYYHRHASWKHLKLLLPWAALGIILGTFIGQYIDDRIFKLIMAITIFISIPLMIWLKEGEKDAIPKIGWFSVSTGIAGALQISTIEVKPPAIPVETENHPIFGMASFSPSFNHIISGMLNKNGDSHNEFKKCDRQYIGR